MYYVLKSDPEDTGAMLMDRPEIPGHEHLAFDDGILIKGDVPLFDLHMDKDSQGPLYDYVWTTFPGLVISSGFRKALEDSGVDNIQYYPIRIVNDVTGEIHTDYCAANVLGRIACLDITKSEVSRRAALPDKLRSIEYMHLDEAKIDDYKIFRLAEYVVVVIVNEAIRDACVAAGLKGCVFQEAEGYSTL